MFLFALFFSIIIILIGFGWLSSRSREQRDRYREQQDQYILQKWYDIVEIHEEALVRRFRQIVMKDPYGGFDLKPWDKELEVFRETVGIGGDLHLIAEFDRNLTEYVISSVNELGAVAGDLEFTSSDPYEYERWCAQILRNAGWEALETKLSGDQGVDIVAKKDGRTLAVQCKLYISSVGNKAVQEIYAASAFVDADFSVVVAPTDYTRSARQLAGKLGVLLLHHSDLMNLDRILQDTNDGLIS